MRKTFTHSETDYLGYKDLLTESISGRRHYATPEGLYPSVTSVLGILSEDSIRAWRKRVGEEEANRISTRASRRGTSVHLIIEKYINNEEDYRSKFTPDIIETFNTVKPILDSRIGVVYGQELPLYSKHLGLAGRVDCIAQFDGVPSIIDFKTSKKIKKHDDIHGYFMQECAYAIMWEERTGMPITNLVTIMSVDDEEPLVFKEHRDNWVHDLKSVILEYGRRTNGNT